MVEGDVGRLVPRAQERRNQGIHHLVPERFAEEEDPEHDADGDGAQDGHRPLDHLEEEAKVLDVLGVVGNEFAGKHVGPESLLALSEGYL